MFAISNPFCKGFFYVFLCCSLCFILQTIHPERKKTTNSKKPMTFDNFLFIIWFNMVKFGIFNFFKKYFAFLQIGNKIGR